MKSIIQKDETCCAVCGCTYGLHKHHIFGGANRKISEKNGFVVHLCGRHHNLSDEGVHFNKELDMRFKRLCQAEYERTHSREEFMRLIGRNYIWDEENDEPALGSDSDKFYVISYCNESGDSSCDYVNLPNYGAAINWAEKYADGQSYTITEWDSQATWAQNL